MLINAWWNALVLVACCGAVLTVAERLIPGDATTGSPRHGDHRAMGWLVAYILAVPALGALAGPAYAAVSDWAGRGPVGAWPLPARFAIALGVYELIASGLHRALHASAWGRRIHRVHHHRGRLAWTSSFRFHPVEIAASHALPVLGALATGAGASATAPVLVVAAVVTLLAHADVWIPDGPVARTIERFVVTPRYHRAHHRPGAESHFALILPVVDALWGRGLRLSAPARAGRSSARRRSPHPQPAPLSTDRGSTR